jgi:hypothetical protein
LSNQESSALVMPPKIESLIEALKGQRSKRDATVAEQEIAAAELRKVDGELGTLRARVAEREVDLARSGAPIPEAPFPEETQLARLEKQRRVLALRRDMVGERLKESEAQIGRLKGEIDAAWLEFGKEQYQEALQQFEQAALVLRERYGDVAVLATVFRPLHFGVPEVAVGNISTHGAYINNLDPVWNRLNEPERRELYASLCSTRAEIEATKAGN